MNYQPAVSPPKPAARSALHQKRSNSDDDEPVADERSDEVSDSEDDTGRKLRSWGNNEVVNNLNKYNSKYETIGCWVQWIKDVLRGKAG